VTRVGCHRVVSLDFNRDFSKDFKLYSGSSGAVGQDTGVLRPDILLVRPPRFLSLLASSCCRLADRRLRGMWRSLRVSSRRGGVSSRLSTVSADLLRFVMNGLTWKLLAVLDLLDILVGITAELRLSAMCLYRDCL